MKRLSFNEEMMKAWLDGRKTVTRRLMKPQPYINDVGQWLWKWHKNRKEVAFWPDIGNYGVLPALAPYSPGETVFIAERYSTHVMPSGRKEQQKWSGSNINAKG